MHRPFETGLVRPLKLLTMPGTSTDLHPGRLGDSGVCRSSGAARGSGDAPPGSLIGEAPASALRPHNPGAIDRGAAEFACRALQRVDHRHGDQRAFMRRQASMVRLIVGASMNGRAASWISTSPGSRPGSPARCAPIPPPRRRSPAAEGRGPSPHRHKARDKFADHHLMPSIRGVFGESLQAMAQHGWPARGRNCFGRSPPRRTSAAGGNDQDGWFSALELPESSAKPDTQPRFAKARRFSPIMRAMLQEWTLQITALIGLYAAELAVLTGRLRRAGCSG